MRIERTPLHLLRRIVIGLQPHGRQFQFGSRVNIRMSYIYPAIKDRRLAEYDIFLMDLVLPNQIFDALKPNQVNHTRSVREMGYQPSLSSFARRFKTQYLAFQLNIRHRPVNLLNVIDTATVHIFVREVIQQVVKGKYAQFLIKHRSTLRPDARQIFYVTRSQIEHDSKRAVAIFKSKGVVILIFSRLPSVR